MKETLKNLLEHKPFFSSLIRFQRQIQLKRKYRHWKKEGGVAPMPNYGKQRVVIDYIKRFSPEVFIETGTYKGKMVYAVQPHIKEIYSIELGDNHYQKARQRFSGYPNVHILQGQSGEVLPMILSKIDKPCLFWLDAHWSGGSTARAEIETPIMQEMQCILTHTRADEHVILIDDARYFIGKSDYPTLEEMESYIKIFCPEWIFEVKDDIIRTHSDT
jgi:hypothetical protein